MKNILAAAIIFVSALLSTVSLAQAPPTPGPAPIVCPGGTTSLAVTTATATAPLALTSVSCRVVTFLNDGTAEAFITIGDNTVVATTAGTPVPAGASISAYVPATFTNFAAITAAGTTTLRAIQANGPVAISGGGSGGGGGGGAVTIADGASVTLGSKADNKSTATDTTPITAMSVLKQISASIQAAATSLASSLTQQTTTATNTTTLAAVNAAITPVVSGSLGNNLVVKASAGSLFSAYASNITGGTSGFLQIFDATSAPGDGAVTPKVCVPIASGQASANYQGLPPAAFATGITAVVSSATTCFTKTTGVITAFISGLAR